MKYMIHIKTTKKQAKAFIKGLTTQGYEAERAADYIHFTLAGKTSVNYNVYFNSIEGGAIIGVRPQ